MRCLRVGMALAATVAAGCGSRGTAVPPAPAAAPLVTATRPLLRDVPVPGFYSQALASGTRSASGAPGPAYWQNGVSYTIQAELDPESATLRGSERIVYRNRSPDALPSVLLNLYQNVFAEGVPRNRTVTVTGGVTLGRVAAQGQTLERRPASEIPVGRDVATAPSGYSVQGTLGRVRLPTPVQPGDSVVLEIDWQHEVPPPSSFRTAWEDALGSRVFHVAQWYPQVATYDDLRGWDATPYLGDGEFYLEYGDFDVSITLPAGFLVGATGQLVNSGEVLTEEARQRLDAALSSDTVTRVVTAADLAAENATQAALGDQLTWRFTASDVRDFAFATSDGYVWDATRASVGDGSGGTRAVAVHALYRPGAPNWEDAAVYGQHSTELISRLVIPYLYDQITIAEGPITGMEYPMIVFIPRAGSVEGLYGVIAHEVAHEWFPMIIGQDEAAFAWMDEGMATYFEDIAAGDFFDDPASFAADIANYLSVAGTDAEVPMMRHTDLVSPYGARTVAAYSKPGVLFRALRTIMGENAFREALDSYAREWLLKHPSPWDFFSTFERVAGRDLDWFFYPWWFETGVLDHGIASVEGAASGRAVVTIVDEGEVPAPALVFGVTAAGEAVGAQVPIETWLAGTRTATVTLEAPAPIVAVVIDPTQIFPDADMENNVWEAPRP
ncbi:MAG: M1 family metallopeptidase [Gemmatimonadota bacterium]